MFWLFFVIWVNLPSKLWAWNEMACKNNVCNAKKELHALYNATKESLGCQEGEKAKHRRIHSFDHKWEKCGIKIQGQALMFTQEKTRTWHSLGSWICEVKASGPTSYSTMHNFPLAGWSGMPEYFLIHLSGVFLLWPPASVPLYITQQAGHTGRAKGSALTAA